MRRGLRTSIRRASPSGASGRPARAPASPPRGGGARLLSKGPAASRSPPAPSSTGARCRARPRATCRRAPRSLPATSRCAGAGRGPPADARSAARRSVRTGQEGDCGSAACQGSCLDSLPGLRIDPMEGQLLVDAFRYSRWANLQLLEDCTDLSPEQLGLSAAGTYGTIADTFMHLLGAEQRYIRRLTGSEPGITENDEFPGIRRLLDEAKTSGARLIELAGSVGAEELIMPERLKPYSRLEAGVVLLQALHHGNDHRTHVCTILGAHGIGYRDMDVWAYGRATGAARVS